MAITRIGTATGTTTGTLPTHQAGDLLIAISFRDGSNTAPTLAAGWTSYGTNATNSMGARLAARTATASGTAVGTFTNATGLILVVYRGAKLGSAFTAAGVSTGATNSVTHPAVPNFVGPLSSIITCIGHRSVDTNIDTAPTGFTNVTSFLNATNEVALHQTTTDVSSFAGVAQTITGTASGWAAFTLELIDSGAMTGSSTLGFTNSGTLFNNYPYNYIESSTKPSSLWTDMTTTALGSKSFKVISTSDNPSGVIAAIDNSNVLYVSNNGGSTWSTPSGLGTRAKNDVSVSADGSTIMVAVSDEGGGTNNIYVSTNSGVSFTAQNSSSLIWNKVAVSGNGAVALSMGWVDPTTIYRTTNYGTTWTATALGIYGGSASINRAGTYAMVTNQTSDYPYTSTDGGATFTRRTGGFSRQYLASAIADNGTTMVAAANGSYIYVSSDAGVTWTERTSSGARAWNSVNISADGLRIVATVSGVGVYLSDDFGVTWVLQTGAGNTTWVSVSATNDLKTIYIASSGSGAIKKRTEAATTSTLYFTPSGTISASYAFRRAAFSANNDSATVSGTFDTGPANPTKIVVAYIGARDSENVCDSVTIDGVAATIYSATIVGGHDMVALAVAALPTSSGNVFATAHISGSWGGGQSSTLHVYALTGYNAIPTGFTVVRDDTYPFDTPATVTASAGGTVLGFGSSGVTPMTAFASTTATLAPITTSFPYYNAMSGIAWNTTAGSFTAMMPGANPGAVMLASFSKYVAPSPKYTFISTVDSSSASLVKTNITSAGTNYWSGITSSADGKLVYSITDEGAFKSTDSGTTWAAISSLGFVNCVAIKTNYSGQFIVMCAAGTTVYISNDYGITWTTTLTSAYSGAAAWVDLDFSRDGSRIVATAAQGIMVSSDSGASWSEVTPVDPDLTVANQWIGARVSENGSRIVAVNNIIPKAYVSEDAGTTWTLRTVTGMSEPNIFNVAISADGNKIAINDYSDRIFTSADSGATWVRHADSSVGGLLEMNADGSILFSGGNGGYSSVGRNVFGSSPIWNFELSLGYGSWAGLVFTLTGKIYAAIYGDYCVTVTYNPTYTNTMSFTSSLSSVAASSPIVGSSSLTFTHNAVLGGRAVLQSSVTGINFSPGGTLSATGRLVGSSNLSLTSTATLTANASISGSANVSFTSSAQLSATVFITGSSSFSLNSSGTLAGKGALTGSSNTSFTNSATLTANAALVGSSSIALVSSGILYGTGAISGVSALNFASNAAIRGDAAISGSSSISFISSGTGGATSAIVGSSSLSFSSSGDLKGSAALAGSATLSLVSSASISAEASIVGAGATSFISSGFLQGHVLISGSSSLSFDNNATLSGKAALVGSSSIAFNTQATGGTTVAISGSSSLNLTSVATLSGSGAITGSSTLAFSSSGTLKGTGIVGSASFFSFSSSGTLKGSGALAGSAALIFFNTASPGGGVPIFGSTTLTFALSGTMSAGVAISGSTSFSLTPIATLTGKGALTGSANIAFNPLAAISAVGQLIGSANLTLNTNATLGGVGRLVGSSAIGFSGSAAIMGIGYMMSSAPVSLSFNSEGLLEGIGSLTGSSDLSFTFDSRLTATGRLVGQTNITFSVSGTPTYAENRPETTYLFARIDNTTHIYVDDIELVDNINSSVGYKYHIYATRDDD